MRLLLIRHGQTPSNVTGALDTAYPGAALTPLGTAQAQAIPAALADEQVSAVYASVLTRTQLTAAPLAARRALDVQVRDGLQEITAGDLEMRNDEDAVRTYIETVNGWAHGDLGRTIPGGEDGHGFLGRFDAAVAGLAAEHDDDATLAVVSHGAALRLWAPVRAANVDTESAVDHFMANTGMVVMEGTAATGWELVTWHPEPLGGAVLLDQAAHDVTGEPEAEALEAAR